MKNVKVHKHLLVPGLVCVLLLQCSLALGQVDKAMKYAWFFDYEKAEKYLNNNQNELSDSMVVSLAEVLYQQGKYPQALYYYKLADKKGALHTAASRRNYVYASTMMREKSPYFKKTNYFKDNYFLYTVVDTFKGNSLNEDFTSLYWNNMLFVTTSRRTSSNDKAFQYSFNKQPYLDVYPFTEKGLQIPYPRYLPKTLNTAVHDGPVAISKDTNLIVITRNNTKITANEEQNLQLIYYVRNATRHWGKPMTASFCKPGYSYQHPYYNEEEKNLYFSSNMARGFGGFDLYKSKWNGKDWSPPVNLGEEINSEYDEVFPGFTPKGELMYASNHIETTGGLDIVLFADGKRYLLNEPFNTIYDDFGVTYKNDKEGYFSSNRFCSKFDDNIYHFTLSEPEKQSLFVKVMDATSGAEIDQAKLWFSNADGSWIRQMTSRAGVDNMIMADTADVRTVLHFTASKPGYAYYDVNNNEYVIKDGKLIKEIYLQKSPIYAADDYLTIDNNRRLTKFGSILDNDSLMGALVKADDVYLRLLDNPLEGLLKVDPTDGNVKVAAGANAGRYVFHYSIGSRQNPSLWDTAQVVIDVRSAGAGDYEVAGNGTGTRRGEPRNYLAPHNDNAAAGGEDISELVAVNDTGYTTINGGYIMNVRNNDRIDGKKATHLNTVIRNEKSDNPNIMLNRRSGAITMSKGVAAGVYHLEYDLNVRGDKDRTDHAVVTIMVRNRERIPLKGSMNDRTVAENDNVIYFNNDEPRSFQLLRPGFNYQNLYESYLKQRGKFYERSVDSRASLDTFFINHVEGGYEELNAALEQVQQQLNSGVQVEISVTAYCSPIASTAYNNKLSERRLASVIRYVKKWNDGALWDAIESNRIVFWEHSAGELEAPKDISEDYNKLNESVFGIKASRERRVSLKIKIFGSTVGISGL